MVSTAMSLELVCIRDLFLAPCFSYLCWKSCRASSVLVCCGSLDLYADDLAVMADSLEECIAKLKVWKEGMEHKGLRVNMKKMKIMVLGLGLDLLCDSGASQSGVGVNSIQCSKCRLWVHKKCSGVRGRMVDTLHAPLHAQTPSQV